MAFSHATSAGLGPVPGGEGLGTRDIPPSNPATPDPCVLRVRGSPPPAHHPHRAALSGRKLRRAVQTHRQAELQVLLSHEQQIPVQGARQRHCSRHSAPARPARRPPLFPRQGASAEAEPKGPETEARRGGRISGILPLGFGSRRFMKGLLTSAVRSPAEVSKYE